MFGFKLLMTPDQARAVLACLGTIKRERVVNEIVTLRAEVSSPGINYLGKTLYVEMRTGTSAPIPNIDMTFALSFAGPRSPDSELKPQHMITMIALESQPAEQDRPSVETISAMLYPQYGIDRNSQGVRVEQPSGAIMTDQSLLPKCGLRNHVFGSCGRFTSLTMGGDGTMSSLALIYANGSKTAPAIAAWLAKEDQIARPEVPKVVDADFEQLGQCLLAYRSISPAYERYFGNPELYGFAVYTTAKEVASFAEGALNEAARSIRPISDLARIIEKTPVNELYFPDIKERVQACDVKFGLKVARELPAMAPAGTP